MEQDLQQKIALVIGASSGIGSAVAIRLARAGASVIVASRRASQSAAVVDEIEAAGGNAVFIPVDVTQTTSVQSLLNNCIEQFGKLDIAVNNAGIEGTPFTATADYDESVFDAVIDTNLKGVWRCMKYEIPILLEQQGVIVNMASIAGLRSNEMMGCGYTASKHAIIGMTKTAAREYAAQGLRINAICPGVVDTEISDRSFMRDENIRRKVLKMHPIGRFAETDEIADAVYWLVSPSSSFVTGHALVIDGGVTC